MTIPYQHMHDASLFSSLGDLPLDSEAVKDENKDNRVTDTQCVTHNFKRRGESYKKGFLLLLSCLPEKDLIDTLEPQAEELYRRYCEKLEKNPIKNFKKGQKCLNALLADYKKILRSQTRLKDPYQQLMRAEQYSVWKGGREPLKTQYTLSPSDSEKGFSIVQEETPIDLDTETSLITFQEYARVNSRTDDQPFWFRQLTSWEQSFIRDNWEEVLRKKPIPSSLRCVPGLANLSEHRFYIDGEVAHRCFRSAIIVPISLELIGRRNNPSAPLRRSAADETFRLSSNNLAHQIIVSLERQLSEPPKSDTKQPHEVVILTQTLLSPGWAATLKSLYWSDASDNDTELYEIKEQVVELFQRALKNPGAPISSSDDCRKQLFFTKSEIEEEQDSSPLCYKDLLAKWGLITQSDGSLQYNEHSIEIALLSTNHPLNALRHFPAVSQQGQRGQRNDRNTALLLGTVARYLQRLSTPGSPYADKLLQGLVDCEERGTVSSASRKDLLETLKNLLSEDSQVLDDNTQRLLSALQVLLATPLRSFLDRKHCHWFLIIAEANIARCINASHWMACKSGKDRTAGIIAGLDAAALYASFNKKLPGYQDTGNNRKLYLKAVSTLLGSGHHQKVSAQNAPGAEGLIRPETFCPSGVKLDSDIASQLASLNKPKEPNWLTKWVAAVLEAIKNLKRRLMSSITKSTEVGSQSSCVSEKKRLISKDKIAYPSYDGVNSLVTSSLDASLSQVSESVPAQEAKPKDSWFRGFFRRPSLPSEASERQALIPQQTSDEQDSLISGSDTPTPSLESESSPQVSESVPAQEAKPKDSRFRGFFGRLFLPSGASEKQALIPQQMSDEQDSLISGSDTPTSSLESESLESLIVLFDEHPEPMSYTGCGDDESADVGYSSTGGSTTPTSSEGIHPTTPLHHLSSRENLCSISLNPY